MKNENHKNEIKQIKDHVKILNITGGIAIGALAIAGYLMLSDPLKNEHYAENNTLNPGTENVISIENNLIDQPIASAQNPAEASSESGSDVKLVVVKKQPVEEVNVVVDKVAESLEDKTVVEANSANINKLNNLKYKGLNEEVQSFEASCNNGSLTFNWVTEGGSKYAYEIEKTYDKVNYEVFSRAPQPEKKDGKNFYMVEEATGKDDDAFYRLRKVVGKGKYEYSEPVNVKCTKKMLATTEVDVFPNGYGSFRIVINTQFDDSFRVSLSDVNENELVADQFEAKPGSNEFVLSSSTISRGNYVLRVTNGSMVKEKRVVLK
jgi:hypothetical protein